MSFNENNIMVTEQDSYDDETEEEEEEEKHLTKKKYKSKPITCQNQIKNHHHQSQKRKVDELVFYDIETTTFSQDNKKDVIEFAAITIATKGFYYKNSYSTLIHSSKVTNHSIQCNGITQEMLNNAPTFNQVAPTIYNILHNKVWVGHNIKTFDNIHLTREFKKINLEPPQPLFLIDTLSLFRKIWSKTHCGDLKLVTLGLFFGLGQEKHRALEDVKLNLSVFKNIAMSLLLEKHYPKQLDLYHLYKSPPSKKESSDKLNSKIVAQIDKAIKNKTPLMIHYFGGQSPGKWKIVLPLSWKHDNKHIFQAKYNDSTLTWATKKIKHIKQLKKPPSLKKSPYFN